MNNKGFSLIELLTVISLLGVILTVTLFSVNKSVKESENKISEIQIGKIEEAAEVYYLKEGVNTTDNETEHCVNLSYLIEYGYLDNSNIIDAYNKKEMNGSVIISFKNGAYNYKYNENTCAISNNQ